MPELTDRLAEALRLVADDLLGGYETEAELAAFKQRLGEIANRVEVGEPPESNDYYFLRGLGSSAGNERLIAIADELRDRK